MSRLTNQTITLEDYRRLEAEGQITRPLTDGPIGADPSRRDLDAAASAVHTEPDEGLHAIDRPKTLCEAAVWPPAPRRPDRRTRTTQRTENTV